MTSNISVENLDLDDKRVAFVEAKPVGWRGTVDVVAFHQALKNAGVPEHLWPSEPTPNKCLERAIKAQKDSRRTLIRPLLHCKGWSVVLEDGKELELEGYENSKIAHSVKLTCSVKTVNDTPYIEAVPWDHPRVAAINLDFKEWQGTFKCSQDLSQWFSRVIVPWCSGIASRAAGGSYYIMKGESLNRMRAVTQALEEVSEAKITPLKVGESVVNRTYIDRGGRIILKPEVASTAAIEILIDNFVNECDNVCDNLSKKLCDSSLGTRALKTQKQVAHGQINKLETLEEFLGTRMDDLHDRLEEVQTNVGLAELASLDD